jgi:hypothetical protein
VEIGPVAGRATVGVDSGFGAGSVTLGATASLLPTAALLMGGPLAGLGAGGDGNPTVLDVGRVGTVTGVGEFGGRATVVTGGRTGVGGKTAGGIGGAGVTTTGLHRVVGDGGAPVAFNGLRNRSVMRSLSPIAS